MQCFVSLLLLASNPVQSAQPYTFDQYDKRYVSALRERLGSFYERLSAGIIPENNYASDVHWNYDGSLGIGDVELGNAIRAIVGPDGPIGDLDIPDYYQVVDGNICGVMYDLQGNQTGEFLGLPLQPGARFNFHGAELGVFDENLELSELITIEPLGRIKAQFAGEEDLPPPVPRGSQPVPNRQTSQKYRDSRRKAMASMHKNILAGSTDANADLATEGVVVNDVGEVRSGRDAFVEIVAAQQQGQGAFPEKQIYDEYIITDGRLGVIEYVWQGRQKGEYMGRAPEDKMVRVRSMLFFEFSPEGLVEKVVSVHDEAVIIAQLTDAVQFLYP